MDMRVDVAIVGAGTAGLAAAREVRKVTERYVVIEGGIPGPCLQVSHTGGKWRRPGPTDWPRCRQPVELSAVGERHLRDKEIMIGRQIEGRSEGQI